MFLIDAGGTLVFWNEAAELMLGKSYAELGAISANDFGAMLELADLDGTALRRRDSPAAVASHRPTPARRAQLWTTPGAAPRPVAGTAHPPVGHPPAGPAART